VLFGISIFCHHIKFKHFKSHFQRLQICFISYIVSGVAGVQAKYFQDIERIIQSNLTGRSELNSAVLSASVS